MRTIILLINLLLFAALPAEAQPKHEIRATWLTTLGGMDWPRNKATNARGIRDQQQELCDILDRLKEANFNTVMMQTRLRGDLIYPSSIETFSESLTGKSGRNPGYDPLAFAIEECHKRGMELHVWIVTIPAGNNRQVKHLGNHSVVHRKRHLCKQHQGAWYLNPGHPGTADYLSSIVCEITSRYDIDGIHLDYIRYPENAHRFPDRDTFRKYGKGKDLQVWRRENITRIVRRLYADVKRLKPWVKVSSSPVGKFRDTRRYSSLGWNAYETVHQDAQGWLREGIHDALFPMMYFKDNHFYPFALDWKENDHNRWVVPGIGIYFLSPKEMDWPLDEVSRQLFFCRQAGLSGQAYFRNRFLMDNVKGILDELEQEFYTAPALVPPMTWQDSIAPSVPSLPSLTTLENGETQLTWSASADNDSLPVRYHLYASDVWPVDTDNPHHLVQTYLQDTTIILDESPDGRYFAVTATDRYGNESAPLVLNQPVGKMPPHAILQICTPSGEVLQEVSGPEQLSPDTLPPGIYLIYLLTPDKKRELIEIISPSKP